MCWTSVFSFYKLKKLTMFPKGQKDKTIPHKREKSLLDCIPDASRARVPGELFYGAFLGLSLLLTGLFLGGARNVQALELPEATISPTQFRLERDVHRMVKGYPIDDMLPYITTQDRDTAAFIVGIAKKESNWGKRVPRTETGEDCYNYWGFRGEGSRGMAMGHGCFGSRKEAVRVVSKRIDTLMHEYDRTTAKEMVVWKCGYSCVGHSDESVEGWISDVSFYAEQVQQTQ
jgi:hypothetical protein